MDIGLGMIIGAGLVGLAALWAVGHILDHLWNKF